MQLHAIAKEVRRCSTRRVGRGPGSGNGKTAGRGMNGAGSRSGHRRRLTYEGGQLRLFQRLPNRGFKSRGRIEYDVVNIETIDRVFSDGEMVTTKTLRAKGIVKSEHIKILGDGELTKKLKGVEGLRCSASARKKLEAQGVSIIEEKE